MSPNELEHNVLSITKDELSKLKAEEYEGSIVLVDSEEEADRAVESLSQEAMIGFDTETRPSFKKGTTHTVALMQLSNHTTCYLFRLNHIGVPESLKQLLENENIMKIGLSIHDDFHNLNKITDFTPGGFVDLQTFVKDYNIFDNSLTRIYGILFGKRISKGQRLTNWEADELTENQQSYAALDALACIHIYDYLQSGELKAEESPYFRPLAEVQPNCNPEKSDDASGEDEKPKKKKKKKSSSSKDKTK